MSSRRRPGQTYLAIRLLHGRRLLPADPNGLSDPYAVVEFDGAVQSSRVVRKTLNPDWGQTLYLPLRTMDPGSLHRMGPITIRVFDLDEAGSDLLGSCEVPLHLITSADVTRLSDETDGRSASVRRSTVPEIRVTLYLVTPTDAATL